LRAEAVPALAPAVGRRQRDLSPHRLSLRLTYTQAIIEAGGVAVVVPTHGFFEDTATILVRLDGLVFSGGPDIDPAVYGEAPHPQLRPDVDRVGDEHELALLTGAAKLDHNQGRASFEPAHTVSVTVGSLLHRLTGATALEVNSYHHQAVDRIGAGLRVCALARDSTVEAVWDPSARFCLGVQWHPEVLTHRLEHAPLLEAFVDAARGAPALALAA
jgi:putative glutamine amidotransferase